MAWLGRELGGCTQSPQHRPVNNDVVQQWDAVAAEGGVHVSAVAQRPLVLEVVDAENLPVPREEMRRMVHILVIPRNGTQIRATDEAALIPDREGSGS